MRAFGSLLLLAAAQASHALMCGNGTTCVCSDTPCDNFQCDTDKSCLQAVLLCDGTRCHMDCTGKQSCTQSHLECISDYCQVRCAADQSCESMRTYAQTGIITKAKLDPVGKTYGLWMSGSASTGKLICDGQLSCQQSSIGCASASCEAVCNGVQSCQQSIFTVTADSRSALMRCTNTQACQQSSFDLRSASGTSDVWCDNTQACQGGSVACPAGHSCTVHCQGMQSCKKLRLSCPAGSVGNATRCHIDCVGQDACLGIGEAEVEGDFTATCSDNAGCSDFLKGHAGTSTPAPATLPPGIIDVIKRVFRIVMRILMHLLDRSALLKALVKLLGKLVRSLKVYWTCPTSACTNGCPPTAVGKLAAGCVPLLQPIGSDALSQRAADLLGDEGTVLEFGADYGDAADEQQVQQALESAIAQGSAQPADLQEYQLQSVATATTAVPEEDGEGGGGGLGSGYVVLIVLLAVVSVAGIGLVARHLNRRQAKSFRGLQEEDGARAGGAASPLAE